MTRPTPLIMTIGHANRSLGTLLRLLDANAVRRLVDVRAVPRSRRHPQFNPETFGEALRGRGIRYERAPRLRDTRRPRAISDHIAREEAARRDRGSSMRIGEYVAEIEKLLSRARREAVAVFFAEQTLERGHCQWLADALVARGALVEHIFSPTRRVRHVTSGFARTSKATGNDRDSTSTD